MSTPDQPPIGFSICYPDEPFEMHSGPFYIKESETGIVGGFRAKNCHTNVTGTVHGGALTTFADAILPIHALREIDTTIHWLATITLNAEFIGPVFPGDWVECRGSLLKKTRSLAFVSGQIYTREHIAINCSTVLKIISRQ